VGCADSRGDEGAVLMKKLFIVNTFHRGYDESDPYIVVAEDERDARDLVERHESFIKDRDLRRRCLGELPWKDYMTGKEHYQILTISGKDKYGIKDVVEVSLDQSRIIWAVFNAG